MKLFYRPYNIQTGKWRYILRVPEFECVEMDDLRDVSFIKSLQENNLEADNFIGGDYEEISDL